MKKYILKGVSNHAERYLSIYDLESLESMIGSEIELCDRVCSLGRALFSMPDGEITHSDFLIIEEVNLGECNNSRVSYSTQHNEGLPYDSIIVEEINQNKP